MIDFSDLIPAEKGKSEGDPQGAAGMFDDLIPPAPEKNDLAARMETPVTRRTTAIGGKALEGFKEGFGDQPYGSWIKPEDAAAYPRTASAAKLAGFPIELAGRTLSGGVGAIRRGAEESYNQLGGNPDEAKRFGRDIAGMVESGAFGEGQRAPPIRRAPSVLERGAVAEPPLPQPRAPGDPAAPHAAPPWAVGGLQGGSPPPPLPVQPVVRPKSEARLLPPETSHALPPEPMEISQGRTSAGAAASGIGPLTELSPQAERMVRKMFEQEGLSPHMIEQRISEMSPHEFLGEISPNTRLHMSGIQSHVGQARNEIHSAVIERGREAPERMNATFTEAFGPERNGVEFSRRLKEARTAQSGDAWKAFLQTPVTPFPGMEALMGRLEAAGAIKAADKAMREWGHPTTNRFDAQSGLRVNPDITTGGPARPERSVLTAATWQEVKEHLDGLIARSLAEPGKEKAALRYTALKNDLIKALDNHPDPRVAGLWKDAREKWAGPSQLISAYKLGERALTGNIHMHELPVLIESYGPRELDAVASGMHGHLRDRFGRPGKQERGLVNLILAKSNQQKIATIIGEEKASNLFSAIDHEGRMHTAPTDIIYGSQTAPREAAKVFWSPAPPTIGGIPTSVGRAKHMALDAGISFLTSGKAAKDAVAFEKIREEVARIMTLQGAERDAALHYFATPRPVARPAFGG